MTTVELGSPELQEVARVLARATGLSLGSGLQRTLRNGLVTAAEELAMTPLDFARKVIAGDPHGVATLIEHAVVGETYFYRHPEQLHALAGLLREREGPLRIWSAGCASGEEPYSIAMALLDAGRGGRGDRIVATDVSERALRSAESGIYSAWSLRRMPAHVRSGHLHGEGQWRVSEEARALVEFRRHNLVADPPPSGPFDAVLCRNVLIYFEPPTAAAILYRLAGALAPGGFLVLSPVDPSAGFWGTIADRVPLVTVGDALPGVRTAGEVVFDNRAGVTLALTHLRDLGHTRVGVLTPTAASTPDRPGDVHVRAEAERLGIDVTIVPARHALAAAAEAACTALARRPRPTALFCFSDSIAYGAYAAAAGLGLDVPGDLSVMGYDARPVSRLLGPPLTTVDWDTDAIVAAAARLVTAALDGQARRRRIVRHPTLLTGASTARPRRRVSR